MDEQLQARKKWREQVPTARTPGAVDARTRLRGLLLGALLALLGAPLGATPASADTQAGSAVGAVEVINAAVEVTDAYIREAPPGQQVNAGFMIVTNRSAAPLTLTGARAARAGSIELHTHRQSGGQMRMLRLPHIHIAPGATVRFASGGLHLMLFNLAPRARAGEHIEVLLDFDNGSHVPVAFAVRTIFEETR